MSDVYQTPESNLVQQSDYNDSEYGSIEDAITGNYKFEVGEVISEAWEKTKGVKGTFFLTFIMVYIITIVVALTTVLLIATVDLGGIGSLIMQVIMNLVILPICAGMFIMGIKRSVHAPIQVTNVFGYFNKSLKLFGAMILINIFIIIGYLLLILPGIYLTVAYMMAIPLIAEKNIGVWEAMETSRKAITKKWFSFLLFMILMGIIIIISSIPLGIGLIWTFPLCLIAYGIIYRNMFGISSETLGGDATEDYVDVNAEADPVTR